jgi:hypothetical protein
MNRSKPFAISLLVCAVTIITVAQSKTKPPVCKATALAAFKPLPKLKYSCDPDLSDYDQKLLKLPNRIRAIKAIERQLELLTSAPWWQADVDDLNLCELRRKPGVLSKEEQEKMRVGDYNYDLMGSHSVRLALLPDPCFMTEYFGSNGFLLYRKGGRVFVTQVLDGFSSHADNPVRLAFADLNGQQIIEISTGTGGLHPSMTNYYFAIDPRTNKAVPRKLFKTDKGILTNEISSDLLMDDPESIGLPKDASELNIIRGHKLAPSFSTYSEDNEGTLETLRGKMTRTILKWDGHAYQ